MAGLANHAHDIRGFMAPLQLKLLLEILMWSVRSAIDTAKIIAKPKERRTFFFEAWHERYLQ